MNRLESKLYVRVMTHYHTANFKDGAATTWPPAEPTGVGAEGRPAVLSSSVVSHVTQPAGAVPPLPRYETTEVAAPVAASGASAPEYHTLATPRVPVGDARTVLREDVEMIEERWTAGGAAEAAAAAHIGGEELPAEAADDRADGRQDGRAEQALELLPLRAPLHALLEVHAVADEAVGEGEAQEAAARRHVAHEVP